MTNTSEELDYDYTAFIAQRAIALMTRLKIAQTPANYSIWFNYCQGTSPGLKRAIDTLFESEASFDATTSAALISNFGSGEAVSCGVERCIKTPGFADGGCAGLSADCDCG